MFYVWPYSYYGQHVDNRVQPQRPDLVKRAIKHDYAFGSHVAPPGLLITTDNALPVKYHNGAFISEHGSWDRSPLSGYQVVFVAFQQGKPVVTDFHPDDQQHLYDAPVGWVEDKEGALIVADDVGNSAWRVRSAAHREAVKKSRACCDRRRMPVAAARCGQIRVTRSADSPSSPQRSLSRTPGDALATAFVV